MKLPRYGSLRVSLWSIKGSVNTEILEKIYPLLYKTILADGH